MKLLYIKWDERFQMICNTTTTSGLSFCQKIMSATLFESNEFLGYFRKLAAYVNYPSFQKNLNRIKEINYLWLLWMNICVYRFLCCAISFRWKKKPFLINQKNLKFPFSLIDKKFPHHFFIELLKLNFSLWPIFLNYQENRCWILLEHM